MEDVTSLATWERWADDIGRVMYCDHFTRAQTVRAAPLLVRLRSVHSDYDVPSVVLQSLKPTPMDARLRQAAREAYDREQKFWAYLHRLSESPHAP